MISKQWSVDHIIDIGPEAGLNGGQIRLKRCREITKTKMSWKLFIWKKIYFNSKKNKNSKNGRH